MVKHKELEDKKLNNVPQKHVRKPYSKPQLVEYGHMEKLTESGGSKTREVGGGRFPF